VGGERTPHCNVETLVLSVPAQLTLKLSDILGYIRDVMIDQTSVIKKNLKKFQGLMLFCPTFIYNFSTLYYMKDYLLWIDISMSGICSRF